MPRRKSFGAEAAPLPTTRKEQLKDTLRWRFGDYILVSVYMFIFLIPLLFWLLFSYYTFLTDVDESLLVYILVYGVSVPLIVVFGLGIGGGTYFFKKLYYGEGTEVSKDFFAGVRKNAKGSALSFLAFGLVYFVMNVLGALIDYSTFPLYVKVILIALLYVLFIFVFAITIYMYSQSLFYNATFTQLMTNSVRFLIGDFLRSFGVVLMLLAPFFFFSFLPYLVAQGIVVLICAVFYFGFSTGVYMLYCMYLFDRVINKKNYPEIYHKGLKERNVDPLLNDKK